MEKRLYLPYAAMVLSIFLPYGVIEGSTEIFTTIQRWLFPFWYFIHDYGVFLGRGVFRFLYPFSWYDFPLVLLGLMLFVLGLSTSKLLHELYLSRVQRRFFILLLLGAFASQIITTSLVFHQVYISAWNYAIPLPIHTLLVLILAALVPDRSVE